MEEKKKANKKKVAVVVVLLIAIVVIVATSILKVTSSQKQNIDPALALAMSYTQVADGDENMDTLLNSLDYIQVSLTSDGESVDTCDYVQFDAFFLQDVDGDGYAEGIRGTCNEVNSTATLYMELNVLTNGTFEDGKITIYGDNMKLATSIVTDSVIDGNYISSNTTSISLKDVNCRYSKVDIWNCKFKNRK